MRYDGRMGRKALVHRSALHLHPKKKFGTEEPSSIWSGFTGFTHMEEGSSVWSVGRISSIRTYERTFFRKKVAFRTFLWKKILSYVLTEEVLPTDHTEEPSSVRRFSFFLKNLLPHEGFPFCNLIFEFFFCFFNLYCLYVVVRLIHDYI